MLQLFLIEGLWEASNHAVFFLEPGERFLSAAIPHPWKNQNLVDLAETYEPAWRWGDFSQGLYKGNRVKFPQN